MGRDQGPVCRLILAQLRQVQQHDVWCAKDRGRRQGRRAWFAGRQIIDRPVLPHRIDAAQVGVRDGHQAQFRQAAIVVQEDHVARIQRQARGRQAKDGTFAANPRLHQSAATAALGFFGRNGHREGFRGDAGGVDSDAPRFDLCRVIVLVGPRDLPLQRLRQFGFLRAGQFHHIALRGGGCHHAVGRNGQTGNPAPHQELDAALAFDRIEAEMPGQRGN